MGISTVEARAGGQALTEAQRRAGIGSNAGADDSQTRTVEALAFDDRGNPTVVLADGQVVGGETEGWVAVGRAMADLPLTGDIPRTFSRIYQKRRPRILGR